MLMIFVTFNALADSGNDWNNDWTDDAPAATSRKSQKMPPAPSMRKNEYKPKNKQQKESENLLIDFEDVPINRREAPSKNDDWNAWAEEEEEAWASLSNGRMKGKGD